MKDISKEDIKRIARNLEKIDDLIIQVSFLVQDTKDIMGLEEGFEMLGDSGGDNTISRGQDKA